MHYISSLKGTVHPKMKILSSFTHPQVFPNRNVFVLLNTKEDILKKVCTSGGTIDFHSRRKKNTMEVNGAPELLCFPHSSEYRVQQNKHIHTGLELLEGE